MMFKIEKVIYLINIVILDMILNLNKRFVLLGGGTSDRTVD